MKASFPTFALAGLFAALAAAPAPAAPNLVGVTYDFGQLLSIDGATGASTVIGSLPGGSLPTDLAFSGGSLYTFSTATDQLLQLNPATGATLATTGLGISGATGDGGLAFNGAGVGFLAVTLNALTAPVNDLFTFAPGAATATLVGASPTALSGLAFSGGTLYGLGNGDGNIYTVSTTTGADTLLGSLGLPADPTFGFPLVGPGGALTASGGTLYATVNTSLFTVNTATGAGTLIGPIADATGLPLNDNVSGLAAPAAAVPEASPALLLGLGLLPGLLALRRRRA